MSSSKIGIAIPCFNEAGNLENLIRECEFISQQGDFEFVLVNNGSRDDSEGILSTIDSPRIKILNLQINAGYGGGILAGLRILETEYVGWIHADMQTDLRESLLDLKDIDFDYFKGVRFGRSTSERFFSAGMGIICSILFRTPLTEINAQPTIMKRSLFDSWVNPPTDFSLDLYSLVFAKKMQIKVTRSKYEFSKRTFGHSAWNHGLKSRVRMILRTLRYAFQLSKTGVQ